MPTEPLPDSHPASAGPFSKSRYRFTSGVRAGEVVTIRSDGGEPILTYRSFASVVGIVALTVSVIVAVTGMAAVLFLLFDGRPFPATMAFLLSAAFTVVIAMLVPTTHVTLYEGSHPVLHIAQQQDIAVARAKLQAMPRDASPVRLRNRCAMTGRPRGTFRKFGLGRNKIREIAMRGEIPGMIKASW